MARSAGFGSIRKLPSKRWQARYYGPDTRYHSGPHTFQTKADAQGWLVRERQLITDGTWAPPAVRAQRAAQAELERREHTLAAYAEGWLASRVTSKCPKVSAIYLHTSQSHDRNLAAALTAMAGLGDTAGGEEAVVLSS